VVHAERRRGKSRSRLLYWFRTPPGVKVGRAALDEDAIRLLEDFNPDVEFDWTRMLKAEAAAAQEPRLPVHTQKRHSEQQQASRRPDWTRGPGAKADRVAARPIIEPEIVSTPEQPEPASFEGPADVALDLRDADATLAVEPPFPEEVAPPAEVASTLLPPAAHARLGTEGVMRLRGRYAEILARISERIQDPARRDELKTQADRLNPDSWVTDDEVRAGLEQYESVFESLRALVGRRRRRRRRRGGRQEAAAGTTSPQQSGEVESHGTEAEDADETADADDT
jgi:hypothetical protein